MENKIRKIKNLTIVETSERQCEVFYTMNGETRRVGYYNHALIMLPNDDERAEKRLLMNYDTAPFCDYSEVIKRWHLSKKTNNNI